MLYAYSLGRIGLVEGMQVELQPQSPILLISIPTANPNLNNSFLYIKSHLLKLVLRDFRKMDPRHWCS